MNATRMQQERQETKQNLLQLSTSWEQSPPRAVPILATNINTTEDYHLDQPQLSFEAREGQMLVQAYIASRSEGLDGQESQEENTPSNCPSPTNTEDNASVPDQDESDMFSLEI